MRNKKAFTVVELVIVIAIIAILAAVLIPTFANIIKKANTSKDNQLIRNLNTALAASRAENNNEPHANMTEALAAAEKFGYEVDKINASGTDAEILWDSQNDLFCYFDGSEIKYIPESELIYTKNNTDPKKQIYDVDYWVIRKDVTDTGEDNRGEGEHQISAMYSTYLAGLAGNDATIVITKGLDVGNNTISSIQYNNTTAQRVSIRTNGGTLEVNAPNDTVNHFGDADSVNIIDVKSTSSYHEFGTVPFIQIKSGRLVLEKTADVNGIHLVVTGEDQSISFDNIVLNFGGKTVKLTRDKIGTSLGNDLMLVCKVEGENGDDEYIWLKGDGTFAGNVSVSTKADGSDAEVISEADASYATRAVANYLDGNVAKESGKTAQEAEAASALKGSGTADDPFLIYNYATFQKVSEFYGSGFKYFEVAIEKTDNGTIDCTNWVPVKLQGSIEGNGVVLKNLDSTLFNYASNARDNSGNPINIVKISNMTLNCNIFDTGSTAALIGTSPDDLYVDNVDVHGQIVGYSVGGYVGYGSGNFGSADTRNWQVTFKNCDNDAHLVSFGEGVGGFVQHPYCDVSQGKNLDLIVNGKSLIQIIDSAFTGKITSVSNMDYFAYQGNHIHVMTSYSEAFLSKLGYNPEGTLYKSMTKDSSGMFDAGNYSNAYKNNDPVTNHYPDYPQNGNEAGKYRPNDSTNSTYKLKITSSGTNPANYGDAYTFTKVNGATTARISFMISPNEKTTESGSYTSTYVDETIDISGISNGATFNTDKIRYWTVAINPTGATETGVSGTQFNVVKDFYGKTHNGANIYAVQYASNGEVVGITSVSVCGSNAVTVMYNGSVVKSAAVGTDYEFDTGLDLTNYDVKVVFVDRDSTWYYNFNYYAEFNGTNISDSSIPASNYVTSSTFEVIGSKVIIHNIERKADQYNYGSLRYGIIVTEP